jgi:hypothetical protein
MVIQEIIKQEEWDQIIELTRADVSKLVEKKKKNRDKKEGKHPHQKLSITIRETIPPGEKQTRSLATLASFEEKFKMVGESYEDLHSIEADVIGSKQVTREQMQGICNSLNELRQSLIDSYVEMILSLKENTSEDEWSILVKDMNKL